MKDLVSVIVSSHSLVTGYPVALHRPAFRCEAFEDAQDCGNEACVVLGMASSACSLYRESVLSTTVGSRGWCTCSSACMIAISSV